jgi:hypothetical protein
MGGRGDGIGARLVQAGVVTEGVLADLLERQQTQVPLLSLC